MLLPGCHNTYQSDVGYYATFRNQSEKTRRSLHMTRTLPPAKFLSVSTTHEVRLSNGSMLRMRRMLAWGCMFTSHTYGHYHAQSTISGRQCSKHNTWHKSYFWIVFIYKPATFLFISVEADCCERKQKYTVIERRYPLVWLFNHRDLLTKLPKQSCMEEVISAE